MIKVKCKHCGKWTIVHEDKVICLNCNVNIKHRLKKNEIITYIKQLLEQMTVRKTEHIVVDIKKMCNKSTFYHYVHYIESKSKNEKRIKNDFPQPNLEIA